MRIGNITPYYHIQPSQFVPADYGAANETQRTGGRTQGPGVVVDISPQTWAAYVLGQERKGAEKAAEIAGVTECKTCQSRRYVDRSNDPSVSFQTPAHISPGQSASMVMSHEREHVVNEKARADREGSRVIDQRVTLSTAICPECKRMYVSGGTTRTMTMRDVSAEAPRPPEPDAE